MASVLDKSLDDMIASNPKAHRRPARRGGRGAAAAAPTAGSTARARYSNPTPASNAVATRQATAAATVQAAAGKPAPSGKIIVSNLPPDVNEAQIKELFSTTVGPLREVNLHYDQAGKSKGVAHVQFSRKGDGDKAYEQYNNRLIDGS